MDVAIGMNECQSTAKRPTLGISIAETILLDNSEMNNDGKPNREGKKERKKDSFGRVGPDFAPKKIITSAEKVIILAKIITPKLSVPRKK